MNILAIGAHPDDVELGCGGTLIKAARAGHNVSIYTLTRGEASGDPIQRTEEIRRSAKFIGAKNLWIDNFEDSKLAVTKDLVNHLEYFINKASPDLIFTHSGNDIHHDHRAISLATIESGRFNSNILSYEIPLSQNFTPKVFYDISDVIEEKVELIKIFDSQKRKLYIQTNGVKSLAEYRALQSRLNTSVQYVEAFDVLKICFDENFNLLKLPYEKMYDEKAVSNLHEVLKAI
jgi:LmbE family N-acetylglucosaminyl deacetylase